MNRERPCVRLATVAGQRPVHRADDVAAIAHGAQGRFGVRPERPLRRARLVGQTKTLQHLRPADHQSAEVAGRRNRAWAQVGHPRAIVDRRSQGAIQARPALRAHFPLQARSDRLLRARAQLQADQFLRPGAKAATDIFAADDEVGSVLIDAASEHMDVRLVGVPVIDRNPVYGRSEILACAGHQVAGERAQIGHLWRVLRRDDEAEMVPVVLAALGEGRDVGRVAARIE